MNRPFTFVTALSLVVWSLACDPSPSETQVHDDSSPPEATSANRISPEGLAFVMEMEKGQMEMEAEAVADLKLAEGELHALLGRMRGMIRGKGTRSKKALDVLEASQAAWQHYAEAQLALEWPDPVEGHYGSVHGMCRAQRWTALVNDRIEQLKAMIEIEEGDACFARWPDEED